MKCFRLVNNEFRSYHGNSNVSEPSSSSLSSFKIKICFGVKIKLLLFFLLLFRLSCICGEFSFSNCNSFIICFVFGVNNVVNKFCEISFNDEEGVEGEIEKEEKFKSEEETVSKSEKKTIKTKTIL